MKCKLRLTECALTIDHSENENETLRDAHLDENVSNNMDTRIVKPQLGELMLGENESENLEEPKLGENDDGDVVLCKMNLNIGIEPNSNITHSHNVRQQNNLDGLIENDGEMDSNISIDMSCFKSVKTDGTSKREGGFTLSQK